MPDNTENNINDLRDNNIDRREEVKETDTAQVLSEGMSLSEILYGIVFTPSRLFPVFRHNKPWLGALIFLIIVNIIITLLYFLGSEWNEVLAKLPANISGYLFPLRTGLGLFVGILFFPLSMVFFMLYTAFYHLLSEMAGGRGEVLGLFTAFAYMQILSLLSNIINFFAALMGNYGQIFTSFSIIFFALWHFGLSVIAIREIYLLSTIRAVVVFLLPIAIIIGTIIFMLITSISFFGPLLGNFNSLTL